jgi:hypothetical protein
MAFSLSLVHLSFSFSGSDEASSAINSADNALKQAFIAVLDAEEAGANVSSLIVKLNEAGKLLDEAEMAYRNGDWDGAISKADACIVIANEVYIDALDLKDLALIDARASFSDTVISSLTGEVVCVVGLILAWVLFKSFIYRKMLKMKPEVASDVEA